MTFQDLCESAKSRIHEISTEEAETRLRSNDSVVVIDVRELDEFRAGHVPDARGFGSGILEYHIVDEIPDTEQEIILYCRGGNRSALAADSLRQMGYTNVHSMVGGYRKWNEEGRAESQEGDPIVH
ncbi:MAG: rhodanese-like domain-containing protein [Armatimonadota bacterium]